MNIVNICLDVALQSLLYTRKTKIVWIIAIKIIYVFAYKHTILLS